MTVPLARIDRIVDDEVVTPEVVAEVKKIVEEHRGVFPERSWRYNEASVPLFKRSSTASIVEAAKKFDVDAALVSAVIKAESDFNPHEISNKGRARSDAAHAGDGVAVRRHELVRSGGEHLRRDALSPLAAEDVQRQRRPRGRGIQRRRGKRLEVQRRPALPRDGQLHQPHREPHPESDRDSKRSRPPARRRGCRSATVGLT